MVLLQSESEPPARVIAMLVARITSVNPLKTVSVKLYFMMLFQN